MTQFRSVVFPLLLSVLAAAASPAQTPSSEGSAEAPKQGTIAGTVFDANNGQPVRAAHVSIKGQPLTLVTDTDGRFQVKLSPGTYSLIVTSPRYLDTEIADVVVVAGEVAEASTVMVAKGTVTTVDVVEKVGSVEATAAAMMAERKLAAAVTDGLSSEEIRKTVASDAAGAVEKVTGVSIVGEGYVYVRGLGERYSATMLNNSVLPTTDPERRVVPLDLFPAALIDQIKVQKTYSVDLPGEFSAGLVQMQTVEFPTKRLFRFGLSTGFNTITTFNSFKTYTGGRRDFFGFDDGSRSLPPQIPADDRIFLGRFSPGEVQEFGRAFSRNWEPKLVDSMRPTQTYNIAAGDTWGKLGLVGAITFTNSPQRYVQIQRFLALGGGNKPFFFSQFDDFRNDNEATRLGGVANLAYRISPANKIVWRNTLTRDSDKEARTYEGLYGTTDSIIQAQRLRWIERGLLSTAVEGEHALARLGNTLFRWQFTVANSKRDEPDLRESIRTQNFDGTFRWAPLQNSGLRFFNYLTDRIYEPVGEMSKPFYLGRLTGLVKFGFRGTFRDRQFNARRFRYFQSRLPNSLLIQPTNTIFAPENINPNGLVLVEETRTTDAYDATLNVYGGYALADVNLTPRLRLVGGLRVEDADMLVTTLEQKVPGAVPIVSRLTNRDPLPAVNLIYAMTQRQNLRFGYGRTVSRPDFRELSPFEFLNTLGGFSTVGNPALRRARIDNFDARWEWFLGGDQIIAASYFYKRFTDPIEVFQQPTTGSDLRQSFFNAAGANNQGLELEFRKGLGFLSPRLKQFALVSNYTFVDSEVDLSGQDPILKVLTSQIRPLTGQSRHIYNVIIDFNRPQWRSSSRFFVNSVSRRITDVGVQGLPDLYQERNVFLDFVYQYDIRENGRWSIRFTAENLGDTTFRWTQADLLVRRYQLGRTFQIGTTFSFF
jgi:outer membrane receptor protein involved in Fe transport